METHILDVLNHIQYGLTQETNNNVQVAKDDYAGQLDQSTPINAMGIGVAAARPFHVRREAVVAPGFRSAEPRSVNASARSAGVSSRLATDTGDNWPQGSPPPAP